MNKEEIEELKDFTIDITDIDELALGLEVCSKKSNMVIQEFADTIIQLQQENQQQYQLLKDKGFIIDKLMEENKQLKDNWNMLKEHLKNRYDNGTESISYRQVFMEIREAMQLLEIAQELEKGDSNE